MASYTTLADIDLPWIAEQYGLHELELRPLKGGMANSSFLAKATRGTFVLTVLDNHDHAGATRLARLTSVLFEQGVPTSRVEPALTGEQITDMHGRPVLLKHWLPGRTLAALPANLLSAAGQLLARLHGTPTAGLGLPVGTRRLPPELYRVIEIFPDRDFARWLTVRLDGIPGPAAGDSSHGFVHGDFHADNIVVRPEGSLAVLDWETATIDDPLLDVGMALVGHARWEGRLSPRRAREFVLGYRRARNLTDADLRRLPSAVEHAALIVAFHRYHRHNIRFPDPGKAQLFREMTEIAEAAAGLSFTG